MLRSVVSCVGLCSTILCCALTADASSRFDPVQSGEEALSRGYPWYDARKHDMRPIHVEPSRDSIPGRKSDWLSSPSNTTATRRPWSRTSSSSGGIFGTVGRVLGWTLLALIFGAVALGLGWALLQRNRRLVRIRRSISEETLLGKQADTQQIENLPFPLEPTELDLLAESRRLFESAQFDRAIVYLFSYELVQLDHRQFLRLARGKTNRQYLRELRRHQPLRSILEHTMVRFEDVFFGGRNLTQSQFSSCWDRLYDFHQQLEQLAI